jgi:hypothetical protein
MSRTKDVILLAIREPVGYEFALFPLKTSTLSHESFPSLSFISQRLPDSLGIFKVFVTKEMVGFAYWITTHFFFSGI